MADITAQEIIMHIAKEADVKGYLAGVGGCDLAGGIVSYLAKNPDMITAFVNEGMMALPADLWGHGMLTFLTKAGHIGTPQEARIARTVQRMLRHTTQDGE